MAVRHADDHYAADALVEELRTAELLLVATLRLYALQRRDPAGDHPDWRDGFRAAAIAECAVPAFNALFNIISVAALRPLDVRCPHCRFLGEDEANFLLLIVPVWKIKPEVPQREQRASAYADRGVALLQ